jgi:trehalose 6-phosphate synthase/phosphatase
LLQDEDLYTFFEPDLPSIGVSLPRSKSTTEAVKFPAEKKPALKIPASSKNGPKSLSQNKVQKPVSNSDQKKTNNQICSSTQRPAQENTSWNVLDLKKDNYFSCSVGRNRTNARYTLASPDHVVEFLMELADALPHSLLQS